MNREANPPMSPKTPSPMIASLLILGGTVFGALSALHAVYTLLDLRSPRRLLDGDPSVAHVSSTSFKSTCLTRPSRLCLQSDVRHPDMPF
jgi:hypothetical protein